VIALWGEPAVLRALAAAPARRGAATGRGAARAGRRRADRDLALGAVAGGPGARLLALAPPGGAILRGVDAERNLRPRAAGDAGRPRGDADRAPARARGRPGVAGSAIRRPLWPGSP
jgi:hypothetical protein